MAIWDDLLSKEDRERFDYYLDQNPRILGKRPVLVVIDVTNAFVSKAPTLEAMREVITNCGEDGWRAVAPMKALIATAREKGVPVIYTRGMPSMLRGGGWANRAWRPGDTETMTADEIDAQQDRYELIDELDPLPGEPVLAKRAASAFYQTPLLQYLNELGADTLVCVGGTTSGCVRATVVDAASASFYVAVVQDACFDRFEVSHKVSLMDMQAKYAKVVGLDEAQRYFVQDAEAIQAPRSTPTAAG